MHQMQTVLHASNVDCPPKYGPNHLGLFPLWAHFTVIHAPNIDCPPTGSPFTSGCSHCVRALRPPRPGACGRVSSGWTACCSSRALGGGSRASRAVRPPTSFTRCRSVWCRGFCSRAPGSDLGISVMWSGVMVVWCGGDVTGQCNSNRSAAVLEITPAHVTTTQFCITWPPPPRGCRAATVERLRL